MIELANSNLMTPAERRKLVALIMERRKLSAPASRDYIEAMVQLFATETDFSLNSLYLTVEQEPLLDKRLQALAETYLPTYDERAVSLGVEAAAILTVRDWFNYIPTRRNAIFLSWFYRVAGGKLLISAIRGGIFSPRAQIMNRRGQVIKEVWVDLPYKQLANNPKFYLLNEQAKPRIAYRTFFQTATPGGLLLSSPYQYMNDIMLSWSTVANELVRLGHMTPELSIPIFECLYGFSVSSTGQPRQGWAWAEQQRNSASFQQPSSKWPRESGEAELPQLFLNWLEDYYQVPGFTKLPLDWQYVLLA